MHRSPQAAADALAALQQQQLRRTRRTVQGSDSAIAAQNSFLAQSMLGSKADWNIVLGG